MKILEKFNFNNKKNILLAVLIVGVLAMTVAFAALSTRLSINGTANVAETKWNIRFENWQPATQNTVDGHQNTAVYPNVEDLTMADNTNVTKVSGLNVTLKQPGDYAKYTFEIVNKGTIDAKLDDFQTDITNNNNVIGYHVDCYPTSAKTQGQEIDENYVLAVEQKVYCDIKIEYNDVTNSSSAGQNQVYQQNEISTNLTAQWTWVQNDSSISGNIEPQNAPHFIGNTGWKILNPGVSLENQNFEYWDTQSTKIMSGWHDIPDLYGDTQTYYFVNGIAQKGWLTENNNKYYFSTFDEDDNGYVNCNLLKSTKKMIGDKCYSFDASGVATESTGCPGQVQESGGTYYYVNDEAIPSQSNTLGNWNVYAVDNSGTKQVCQQATGTTICIDPSKWSCDANDCSNKNAYTTQKLQEIESNFGTTCKADSSEKKYECTKYIGDDFVRFQIYYDGTDITAGYNESANDYYSYCKIYNGDIVCSYW